MPSTYLRSLSSKERHDLADLSLARYLTFIAGATNAGGFLAVHLYTSHMSGIVASIADFLVMSQFDMVQLSLLALLAFVLGAAATAILVNWAQRLHLESRYALPLIFEALLLLLFGLIGRQLDTSSTLFAGFTVILLCFLMGLQNALITKISNARIRTTHITGMVTDIGIEFGKLLYWNKTAIESPDLPKVLADRTHLKTLVSLVALFFLGGVVGALGFKYLGFAFTIPLALILAFLGGLPVFDDLKRLLKQPR